MEQQPAKLFRFVKMADNIRIAGGWLRTAQGEDSAGCRSATWLRTKESSNHLADAGKWVPWVQSMSRHGAVVLDFSMDVCVAAVVTSALSRLGLWRNADSFPARHCM